MNNHFANRNHHQLVRAPRVLTPTRVALRIIIGQDADDNDRSLLTPNLLAQLAIGSYIQLTPLERYRLPKTTLAQLALGGFVALNRSERDRLEPLVLTQLAVKRLLSLEGDEYNRLTREQQAIVQRAL